MYYILGIPIPSPIQSMTDYMIQQTKDIKKEMVQDVMNDPARNMREAQQMLPTTREIKAKLDIKI